MAKDDLDDLINDLDIFCDQSKMNTFLENEIDELIASALKEIGIRQIMDTGQARSIFIDIAREHLGVDFSTIFTDVTDIWGNLDRGRDAYNFEPYSVYEDRVEGRNFAVEIYDYGVIGQEEGIDGKTYPSDSRPDKADYSPHHIEETTDDIMTGNLESFEYWVNIIQDKITNKLGR